MMTYCCLLLGAMQLVGQDEETWRVGLARATITPSVPMWMAGYASRDRPSAKTAMELWVKAIALETPAGDRVLLLTCDLVGTPKGFYEEVVARIEKETGLPRANLLIASSHTHCGPVLENALKPIYGLDEEQQQRVRDYTTWLVDRFTEVAKEALTAPRPARLATTRGTVGFAVNRRNNPEGDVPKRREAGTLVGPFDHDVPVLTVRTPEGELLAVLFAYACHNTTLSYFDWHGDYAGVAQRELESRYPGIQAMFLSGCGADQNPLPRRTVELCEAYGGRLAAAVADRIESPGDKLSPAIRTAFQFIDLPYAEMPTDEELEAERGKGDNYHARWAVHWLDWKREGKPLPTSYPYPVQTWHLGDRLWWFNLGGEVVVDYSLRLKERFGRDCWSIAYANDVMAYIPSERVRFEGGYEGATSMMAYGLPCRRWARGIEDRILTTLEKQVTQLGATE